MNRLSWPNGSVAVLPDLPSPYALKPVGYYCECDDCQADDSPCEMDCDAQDSCQGCRESSEEVLDRGW